MRLLSRPSTEAFRVPDFTGWYRLWALGILTAAASVLATCAITRQTLTSSTPLTRFAITLPPPQALAFSFDDRDLVISSDGTQLVYTAGAQAQLMVRPLHQLDAVPLPNITNARVSFSFARWT